MCSMTLHKIQVNEIWPMVCCITFITLFEERGHPCLIVSNLFAVDLSLVISQDSLDHG